MRAELKKVDSQLLDMSRFAVDIMKSTQSPRINVENVALQTTDVLKLYTYLGSIFYSVLWQLCFCSGHIKNTWLGQWDKIHAKLSWICYLSLILFVFYSFCPVPSVLFSFLLPVCLPSLLSLHTCLVSPSLAWPCSQCFSNLSAPSLFLVFFLQCFSTCTSSSR